jgi:hypothetical protein
MHNFIKLQGFFLTCFDRFETEHLNSSQTKMSEPISGEIRLCRLRVFLVMILRNSYRRLCFIILPSLCKIWSDVSNILRISYWYCSRVFETKLVHDRCWNIFKIQKLLKLKKFAAFNFYENLYFDRDDDLCFCASHFVWPIHFLWRTLASSPNRNLSILLEMYTEEATRT